MRKRKGIEDALREKSAADLEAHLCFYSGPRDEPTEIADFLEPARIMLSTFLERIRLKYFLRISRLYPVQHKSAS